MAEPDWKSSAARLASAAEQALPIIIAMFEAFPYAEQDDDDEVMQELKDAAKAFRDLEKEHD